MYEELIIKIIESNKFITTSEQFYVWLKSHKINSKNYISFYSVKNIMKAERKEELIIFRVLLQRYIKITAVQHSATSKRMSKYAVKMHLQGLRQLSRDLLQA
jgi:hypothetical protein